MELGEFLEEFAAAVTLATEGDVRAGYYRLVHRSRDLEEAAGEGLEARALAYRYEIARRVFMHRYVPGTAPEPPSGTSA